MATDGERMKGLSKTRYPDRETAGKGEKTIFQPFVSSGSSFCDILSNVDYSCWEHNNGSILCMSNSVHKRHMNNFLYDVILEGSTRYK